MITVFTPTYNREKMLKRLYESLKTQSLKEFEWVIVDDGSNDNTENLIKKIKKEAPFNIKYKKVKNGGKMRAINLGIKLSEKEFFFIVDSDDFLDEKAIEKIVDEATILPDDFAGVVFRKIEIDEKGDKNFKNDFGKRQIDTNPIDIFYNKKILGDKAEVIRTKILKEFSFPEIEGEKFFPEGYIWNRIGEMYNFRYINEGIYYYRYLSDGYTNNFKKILKDNPEGFKIYYGYMLKQNIPLKNKIKFLIRYVQVLFYSLKRRKK